MVGGIDYEWFKKQKEGIALLTTRNAIRANREGLPDRDTERKVQRRELGRQARYVFGTEGFFRGLGFVLTGKECRQVRRRVLLIALPCIAAVLVIVFCAWRLWIPVSPYRDVNACGDITITGRPFSEEKGCTMDLTLKNTGADAYVFDGTFVMERKIAGIWRRLPALEEASMEQGFRLAPQEKNLTLRCDWTDSYGRLEAGDYRIVIEAHSEQTQALYPMTMEFAVFYLTGKR